MSSNSNPQLENGVKDGKKVAVGAGEVGKDIHDGAIGATKWVKNETTDIKNSFSSDNKTTTTTTDNSKADQDQADAKDADDKDKKKSWFSGIGDWFKSLDVGNLAGGVLGFFGGKMLGGIFGSGIVGTIAGWLLGIVGVFMGKNLLGSKIDSLLHITPHAGEPGTQKTVERNQERVIEKEAPVPMQAAAPLTADEINSILEHKKLNLAGVQMTNSNAPTGPVTTPAASTVVNTLSR